VIDEGGGPRARLMGHEISTPDLDWGFGGVRNRQGHDAVKTCSATTPEGRETELPGQRKKKGEYEENKTKETRRGGRQRREVGSSSSTLLKRGHRGNSRNPRNGEPAGAEISSMPRGSIPGDTKKKKKKINKLGAKAKNVLKTAPRQKTDNGRKGGNA